MIHPKRYLLYLVIIIICGCDNSSRYPYSIKDYPNKLQPHLIKMLDKGIVMSDSVFQHLATDKDLERLGRSEHPILRASAFREMLQRKSFNHFEILMRHLDDTALVFIDAGEFGIWDRTVSDDILQEAAWKTEGARNETISKVVTHHNYLRSAYIILDRIEPREKYYPYIKNMATRPRRLDYYDGYELGFADIEYALYGLASFRKKTDVEIIKNKMMKHVWELSDISFRLMTKYPDTAYFDVLQTYHRRQFYKFSGNRPHGFSGIPADRAAPEDFIAALVVQQTERSAKLLDSMLVNLSKYICMPDRKGIIDHIINAIWEHPCPAYQKLRIKYKREDEPDSEELRVAPVTPEVIPGDTTREKYGWLYRW
jgi:hypothetical protein